VVYLSSERVLSALDQKLVEMFCSKITTGFENIYLYDQLFRTQIATVATLADFADTADLATDHETSADHDRRHTEAVNIAMLTERIARALHADRRYPTLLGERFLEMIGLAAMLHDVGNVAVASRILDKPGPLSDQERQAMGQHTRHGGTILERASGTVEGHNYLLLGAEIARHHHENFDGSGYPDGLAGEAIPLAARIVAVADSYCALVSDRPHRKAAPRAQALDEIQALAGQRFDPVVVDAFLKVMRAEGG
jgi:HD-GYP domain-containing protein (c-di-GMP phosphodiesterase class II)